MRRNASGRRPSVRRYVRTLSAAAAVVALLAVTGGTAASAGLPQPVTALEALAASGPSDAALRAAGPVDRARLLLRCLTLDGEQYCLGVGFSTVTPDYAAIAAADTVAQGTPGDLAGKALVAARMAMRPAQRLAVEQEEVRAAMAGVSKARWIRENTTYLRALGTGVTGPAAQAICPDPVGALAGWRAFDPTTNACPVNAFRIMDNYQTKQERSSWCGPATFQMIDWGDDDGKDSQASWAADLGTTSAGTAITSMVSLTNLRTDWDVAAGTYIVQSVVGTGRDAAWFMGVHRAHLGDGTPAPIIEHPKLLARHFDYLRFDYSGHYQVGRAYNLNTDKIGIFEPFNEKDWNSAGNVTWGVQWVDKDEMYQATLANSSHRNIGL